MLHQWGRRFLAWRFFMRSEIQEVCSRMIWKFRQAETFVHLSLQFFPLTVLIFLSWVLLVEVVDTVKGLLFLVVHVNIFLSHIILLILLALFYIGTSLWALISLILHFLLTKHSRWFFDFFLLNANLNVVLWQRLNQRWVDEIVKSGLHVCVQVSLILIVVFHLIQDECKFNFIIISLICLVLLLSFSHFKFD